MKITLPKPPSINHIYGYTSRGGFARSYITREGKVWFEIAGELLKKKYKKKTPIKTEVEIWIVLYTNYYRQDVDNIAKPILDALQKNGVLENDALVYKIDIEKYKCKKEEQRVEIEIQGY
jgi:Holliday junction resolvase RusA-like endonuclease